MGALAGKNVLLGVSGGIAAYKAAEVVRLLVKAGADVHVVMTPAATHFIGPLTLQTLSRNPVFTDMFDDDPGAAPVRHVALADAADVAILAPATAESLSALAHGAASDPLKTVFLAVRCPTLIAPAMNVSMWQHPAVAANVATLREWGYRFVGPEEGELAEGYAAIGRMSEPAAIVAAAEKIVGDTGIVRAETPTPSSRRDLSRLRVLVTAGPTREPIDAVRFLSNPSSGRMGYAIAAAAQARGAEVTLVSGPTELLDPPGVHVVRVTTAREMLDACRKPFERAEVLVATAAVADFRPAKPKKKKGKKDRAELTLDLARNPDILATLAKNKGGRVCIGFAAETDDVIGYAKKKLTAKNLDWIVANEVGDGKGFAVDENRVTVLDGDGVVAEIGPASKRQIADALWDLFAPRIPVPLKRAK